MTKMTVEEDRSFCGSASSGTKRRDEGKRPCDSCPMPIIGVPDTKELKV